MYLIVSHFLQNSVFLISQDIFSLILIFPGKLHLVEVSIDVGRRSWASRFLLPSSSRMHRCAQDQIQNQGYVFRCIHLHFLRFWLILDLLLNWVVSVLVITNTICDCTFGSNYIQIIWFQKCILPLVNLLILRVLVLDS